MEQYIVSARKYRPTTFKSVVGQGALTTTLKNAIATNHLAHAYLFCGPRGVGKTTCARIFAKTINCEHLTADGEACNECESCRGFNEHRSFNIHELDAASNNSVDDIRSLVDQVRIPPQVGKYSVYIIDEVHMLTTQAFNAFLKTLEEPPAHAVFILATTEKHKIIPTILSRCQIYDFNRIRVADAVSHLQYVAQNEGITAEPEALNVIAQKADGAMRDALSIFDQVVSFCGSNITYKGVIENLNVLDYDYYFRLVDDFLEGQVNKSLLTFDEILQKGFEAQYFISGLAAHFRDLLVSRDEETKSLLEVGASIADQYVEQAKRCPIPFLYKAIEIANECDLNYRQSRNKRLLVELTLVRLCQLTNPTSAAQPIAQSEIKPIAAAPVAAPQPTSRPVVQQPVAQTVPTTRPVVTTPTAQPAPTAPVAPAQPTTLRHQPTTFSLKTKPTTQVSELEPTAVKPTQPVAAVPVGAQNASYTEEQYIAAWKESTKHLPNDAHAINTILSYLPRKHQDGKYRVEVLNTIQQKELEKYKEPMLAFMKSQLNNAQVDFEVIVDDSMAESMALTPEEKFAKMRASNASFDNLSAQLGLEI